MVLDFLNRIFSAGSDSETDSDVDFEQKIKELEADISEIRENYPDDYSSHRIEKNTESINNLNEALESLIELIENFKGLEKDESVLKDIDRLDKRISRLEQTIKTPEMSKKRVLAPEKDSLASSNRPSNRPSVLSEKASRMEEKAENAVKGEELWQKTTPAQKNVLKVLYDSGYPMSYKEIARDLNRTVSTVKNHINNLKSMGVHFREKSGKNNSKKYMVDDRIKGFLTMKLND